MVKLAFDQSAPLTPDGNLLVSEQGEEHTSLTPEGSQLITPAALAVPNSLQRGLYANKTFIVGAVDVVGEIATSGQTDVYRFEGRAGDLFNIQLMSSALERYAADGLDAIVSVFDSLGNLVTSSDDEFEGHDPSVIDLTLPADGVYYVRVSGFETTVGRYELFAYRFDTASITDGSDVIEGRAGDDTLSGGDGGDTYLFAGTDLGSDVIVEDARLLKSGVGVAGSPDGRDNADTLDLSDFGGTVTIDLSTTAEQVVDPGNLTIRLSSAVAAADELATASGIEDLVGSSYGNFVMANSRANILLADGSENVFSGQEGDDLFQPGAGSNTIDGGAGIDVVVLAGCRSDYAVTSSNGAVVLTSLDGVVPASINILTGIETVRFENEDAVLNIVGAGSEYATIQAGIDAAVGGDAIVVHAGHYAGGIVVDKANVSLFSDAGAAATAIEGAGGDGVTVTIAADGVTLQGFTLDSENALNGTAIAFGNSTGTAIRDNVLINTGRGVVGAHLTGAGELLLVGNTFEGTVEDGLTGTAGIAVVELSGNAFHTSGRGIVLEAGVSVVGFTLDSHASILALLDSQDMAVAAGYPLVDSRSGTTYVLAAVSIPEEQGTVGIVAGTGQAGSIAFSIVGGVDAARFQVDAASGDLAFAIVTNADTPADSNADGVYWVIVQGTDGTSRTIVRYEVTVLNVNLAPTFAAPTRAVSVFENNTAAAVVVAADVDLGDTRTYSIAEGSTDNADGARFTIDSLSGALSFTIAPDYEALSDVNADGVYQVRVVATDAGGLQAFQVFSITVLDVNDVAPVFTSGSSGSVAENAGQQTVIYTATRTDGDVSASFRTVAYSIKPNVGAAGLVIIDADSGEVRLAASADFETRQSYTFTIVADDGVHRVEHSVTVDVVNLDEIAPTITSPSTAPSINENSGAGQVVYQALADDSLDISGGVTFSLGGADASLFTIDAVSGKVTLVANPNYEAKPTYAFSVIATDAAGHLSAAQPVTLEIVNLDEIAPTITSLSTAPSINENSGAGQVVYQALADDSLDISGGVTFSLGGTDASLFTIDAASGKVTLVANPNFEVKHTYAFSVTATDAAGHLSAARLVTLEIVNLDESTPTITSLSVAPSIHENSGAGQVVYTALADDSLDVTGGVTFSLGGADASLFTIDATSGKVTLVANPNYEVKPTYAFSVTATDAAGNRSAATAVTLEIGNVDDTAPTITSASSAAKIDENSGALQVVYTALADDSQDASVGPVTFSLAGADVARFTIDTATGEVRLLDNPDCEVKSRYTFTVSATDGVGLVSAAKTVTLMINNLDEVAPLMTSGDTATALAENSPAGRLVYTATATDSVDVSNGYVFALVPDGDSGSFAINPGSGKVTLVGIPNYEAKGSYTFSVQAIDKAGNRSLAKTVTLVIVDVDEVAPTIISSLAASTINENSGAGQSVYRAVADDSGDVSFGVTFKLGGADAKKFTVDAVTGWVTLVANPDFETKSVYTFTVTATDTVGLASAPQAVTLLIRNLDEVAPVMTSGPSATTLVENSGAGQVVYTGSATDLGDTSDGVSYALGGQDAGDFSINPGNGRVTLTANPNYEAKSSYLFTVKAIDRAGYESLPKTVTLQITNLDDTAPTITSAATATTLIENSGAAQAIYRVTASDTADVSGGIVSFGISGPNAGSFAIDSTSGVVRLLANPDYETNPSYSFTVTATDAAGLVSLARPVTLLIINVDDTAPTITSAAVATAIAENSGAGKLIYTATATDSGDVSGGYVFALVAGGDSSCFAINPNSGKVTLVGNPDFETKSSYAFAFQAIDMAGNASLAQAVTLGIVNLDEVAPAINSSATATAINENSGPGQTVYHATADDSADRSDGVSFALSGTDAKKFSIDALTGWVTLAANPDFEKISVYAFSVTATDAAGLVSAPQAVTLVINNLDEVAPTITSGKSATGIAENSGAGQVVYTAIATDLGDISFGVSYALGGADASAFAISAADGTVTLTANPDFETKSSYVFTVRAIDRAGLESAPKTVTLGITNVDETAPLITSPGLATAVAENSATTVVVYTATATDLVESSGGVSFSLEGADAAAFSVTGATGLVKFKASPDFEAKPSYAFTVVATDKAGNRATLPVTLAITNVDEIAPTITSGVTAPAINENIGAGQLVYQATADDSLDVSGGVTFQLGGTDMARFAIEAPTGRVRLLGSPDCELKSRYTFTVTATDAAGLVSAAKTVTLMINNLDEVAPLVTSGSLATGLEENSGTGKLVYTATATDAVDVSNGYVFALVAGGDSASFAINPNSGKVTLLVDPDFETKSSYTFTVQAIDKAGNASVVQLVTLSIINVDDTAARFTSGTSATVAVSAAANATIYTAAVDDSSDVSGGVKYSLLGADPLYFSINSTTGVVTLKVKPTTALNGLTFTVVATDKTGAKKSASQVVTLKVT